MKSNINRSIAFISAISFTMLIGCTGEEKQAFDYHNTELSALDRSIDLVAQMTLKEKVSQMRYDAPSIPRLGVPRYNWWNECLHGVGRAGEATVFPQAIGLGATWNPALMEEIGIAISDEARAKHHKFVKEDKRGIYQGLTFWTPNINIFRDPRWGRGQETYGEDPFLTSRMAVKFINALQGNDENYLKVVATAKHFAVHSGPEKTRHSDNYQSSNTDLKETYLPAFEAAIKEANVQSVMCAYNRFRDKACCGSNLLLDSILRKDWKFDGYVVSDCWAINDFYMADRHGVSNSPEEASALAVKMGTDLNCGNTFDPNLSEAVLKELIDEAEVDKALIRLMSARFKLGMFDDDQLNPYAQIPYDVVRSEKHTNLSLKAARESMVLLKNEDNLLPLSKANQTIAVIGPNANTRQALLGNYHGTSPKYITPLEGIKNKLPGSKILYTKGSDITSEWPLLTPIPSKNLTSENKPGLKGSYYNNDNWGGTPSLERFDKEVDFIWIERPIPNHKTDTFTVRWSGQVKAESSGKYRIGLRACNAGTLFLGGEKVLEFSDDHQPTMRYHDIELEKDQAIDVQIDYYNWHADPQVQLLWAKLEEDLISPAVDIAEQSDVVLLFLGLSPDIEGEEMPVVMEGFDKGDRSDIKLPKSQLQLLEAILQTNKPIILVLMNGSALAINYAQENVPAIIEAWYPGEFGGQAIADVIFGDYNPAGRLPLTYYKSVQDLPEFTDYSMTNRTYKYFEGEPLYAFGHGLSYTRFNYSNLNVKEENSKWLIEVEVANTGQVSGDEVVQVYAELPSMEMAPIIELVGFKRISLSPDESKKIEFEVLEDQLKIYDSKNSEVELNGVIKFSVGGAQPSKGSNTINKTVKILQ